MENKKELIKELKKEYDIELDIKKLNALSIEQLREILVDIKNIKGYKA